MTNTIPFIKMHGLGNDFVIMSMQDIPSSIDMMIFTAKISDRKLGIGCDQFITYDKKEDRILMSIYNQNGSKAKACGNASRCLSRLMFDKYGVKKILLDIDGREVACEYINADSINVDMGHASFKNDWMPINEKIWSLAERYRIEPKEMICVDVANPHLVIFSKLTQQDKEIIGENFQKIDLFKDGINVNFATVDDNKIHLKVWERGAGFTLACGSGACATFAAANKLGFVGDEAEVVFALGSLKMNKNKDFIRMCGPASYVFFGEYNYV